MSRSFKKVSPKDGKEEQLTTLKRKLNDRKEQVRRLKRKIIELQKRLEKKDETEFFPHAEKIMVEETYKKAIDKGKNKAEELKKRLREQFSGKKND